MRKYVNYTDNCNFSIMMQCNAFNSKFENRLAGKEKPRPLSLKVGSFTISRFNTLTYDYYYDCTKKEAVKKERLIAINKYIKMKSIKMKSIKMKSIKMKSIKIKSIKIKSIKMKSIKMKSIKKKVDG